MEEASAALDYVDEDGDEMTRDVIVAAGKDMAKAYYKRCQKNLWWSDFVSRLKKWDLNPD